MMVEINLFAGLRDKYPETKKGPIIISIRDNSTIRDLLEHLGFQDMESLLVLIDGVRQPLNRIIQPNTSIMIFPPIGGG